MEANIRVVLIRNSSSHSSLVVNGLELLLSDHIAFVRDYGYQKVVCSFAVDAKVTVSKM